MTATPDDSNVISLSHLAWFTDEPVDALVMMFEDWIAKGICQGEISQSDSGERVYVMAEGEDARSIQARVATFSGALRDRPHRSS